MLDSNLKAAFAAFYFRRTETDLRQKAFAAAKQLFPRECDMGKAMEAAFHWPDDPEVIAELANLEEIRPGGSGIPTKEQVIVEMWKLVQNERTAPKDRAATSRLIAEMLNYIPKQGEGDDGNKKTMPKVPVYQIVDK